MGSVYQLERDSVAYQVIAPKYCAALRSKPREKYIALRFRIPRLECVLVDERKA